MYYVLKVNNHVLTCNVPRENIEVYPNFPFALKTRLNWAKNCNEERVSLATKGLEDMKGLIGSHLVRKFASTRVCKCGTSKDDKYLCVRWKRLKRTKRVGMIDITMWSYLDHTHISYISMYRRSVQI